MTEYFVPEAVILYVLKHSRAFDWACINCQCRASHPECPAAEGGKWQTSQGETGVDFVAKFSLSRTSLVHKLPMRPRYLVLEAKGDRVRDSDGNYVINRPAYNEMVGSLSAFVLSNLDRIAHERETHLFGWLFTANFIAREIEAFSGALRNLPRALPRGTSFVLGVFRSDKFWKVAPEDLQSLAHTWFVGPEQLRNKLLKDRMSELSPMVDEKLVLDLFDLTPVDSLVR